MSESSSLRRTVAEIRFGEEQAVSFKVGNRSIHQFWHLFSPYFRSVLLAPQRRPESGTVTWTWRESSESPPPTAQELAEVRRRLTAANRALAGGAAGQADSDDPGGRGALNLDAQVRASVNEMVAQLVGKADSLLAGFVGRTETGPMIHSWGAATPAKPYCPDQQGGEISGTVWVGPKPAAGLTVVVENSQATILARAKSDPAGAFRFPAIAPGNYRVRVEDRRDFSAAGLAVKMTRDSVTGLELRASTDDQASAAPSSAATADRPPPWYRHRVMLWLVAAILLGAGSCYWRLSNQPAGVAKEREGKEEWQSASGQVAGGNPLPSATSHPVGGERGFSTLSPGRPVSQASGLPAGGSARSPGETNTAHGDAATTAPSTGDNAAPRPMSLSRDASPATPSRGSAVPASPAAPAGKPGAGENRDAAADAANESAEAAADAAASADRATAKPPAKSATKSSPVLSASEGPSSPSVATKPDGESPADPSQPTPTPSVESAMGLGSKPGQSSPAAVRPAGPARGNATAATENAASTDSTDAATSGRGTGVAPGRASAKGASPGSSPAHAATSTPAPLPMESAAPGDVSAAASETGSAPPPANKSAAKSPERPKPKPGGAAANSIPQADASPPEIADAKDSASANSTPKPTAKAAPAMPSKTTENATTASDGQDAAPSPEAPAGASADFANAGSVAKNAPRKPASRPAAAPNPAPASDQPAEPAPSPTQDALDRGPAQVAGTETLVQRRQVSVSRWETRQVQDVILPTQPAPAGHEESVDALRKKLWQEQDSRMPQTFRQPRITSGLALEFPRNETGGVRLPQWRDASGAPATGATVQGNRAEISWSGPGLSRPIEYVLGYPDGRELARVSLGQEGGPILDTATGVRGWFWVGIERATTEGADAAVQFDWQLGSGRPVPAAWLRNDRWMDGRGIRLDVPLAVASATHALQLVDRRTGWALTSQIAVR